MPYPIPMLWRIVGAALTIAVALILIAFGVIVWVAIVIGIALNFLVVDLPFAFRARQRP